MNKDHLIVLCNKLGIHYPAHEPTKVHGGLLHLMWKLDAKNQSYAIKQLSKDIKLTDKVMRNYELSEQIASYFSRAGIPAISAIEVNGKYLIKLDNTAYLIYPWVEAVPLSHNVISEHHASKIANIVAKMHLINMQVPAMPETEQGAHSNDEILELIKKAAIFNCPFANDLRHHQNAIISANTAYQGAIPILKEETIISHGDLDQKNVLWDKNDNPLLIDWESAQKINPTYDMINTALYWSGITTDHFNQAVFLKMIRIYQLAGGKINTNHLTAAFYGTFSWMGWLVYNIERACKQDPSEIDQQKIGVEQVQQVLPTILRLEMLIPNLINLIHEELNAHDF
jgi:thiamine kinase-like enzyme